MSAYYERDLAWVHDTGFAQYATRTAPGIVRLLREHVGSGARVLDVGCGSGVLARELLAAGYAVTGVDASPAMIELARRNAPGAQLSVVSLPDSLPTAEAIVSTGHVLAYLPGREAIARAIEEMARALAKPGFLAFDLMTDRYVEARASAPPHARVEDDWAIFTRFSSPGPHRFDRLITVFRRDGDGFRRTDEHHENVTFPVEEAVGILRRAGVDARVRTTFGDETKTDGLVVVTGTRG